MEDIVFGVLFIIAIIVALFIIFKPVIADKKVRKNIKNSDSLTQHYSFALNCTESEAIEQLSVRNVNDVLEYSFDSKTLTICFNRHNTSIEHKLSFYNIESITYLKVSRIKLLHNRSNIPLLINRFFAKKLSAEPIDYSSFVSLICATSKE